MIILNQIQTISVADNKKFLVIGGHAVNAYGFSRQTGDLDLLVCKDDRDYVNLTIIFFRTMKFLRDLHLKI